MTAVVSKQMHIDAHDVEQQFRSVFAKAGTVDFRNLVQSLPISANLDPDIRLRLVTHVRRAYDLSKKKQLRSYDNMIRTLQAVEAAGVAVIVVTNAPIYHAFTRVRDVGALPYLYGLVAWSDPEEIYEGDAIDEHIALTRRNILRLARRNLNFVSTFSKADSKPSSHPFELIIERFGKALYYSLGDSLSKDLLPAAQVGMRTIWARYGTHVQDERDLSTLLTMTPWTAEEISYHLEQAFSPDYIIDDPSELLSILPHYDQLDLF